MARKPGPKTSLKLCSSVHDGIVSDLHKLIAQHRDGYDGYRWQYLEQALLSKYVGPETAPPEMRQAAAIEKWLKQEAQNAKTNVRLYGSDPQFKAGSQPITAWDIEERARKIVKNVLGPIPALTVFGSFSGGASTRLRRDAGNSARKYMGQAHVTPTAWTYILPSILEAGLWSTLNPEILNPVFVRGNEMFTVPKSTDIDRVACKEPDLNMWAQKAVGDHISRRLRKVASIDLNDQGVNQELSRIGSKTGILATVDLSSASDSVTTSIVARLLPPDWFCLLDALRCHETKLPDGTWHQNEMFSSMGNGFTFELESLIFYSLVMAIRQMIGDQGRISVYGDDIIAPTHTANAWTRWSRYWGFKTNSSKTFSKGPIRESCGRHWYAGECITPFYIKEPITTVERLIHFLNRLRIWSGRWHLNGSTGICDDRTFPLWEKWSKLVPKQLFGGSDAEVKHALASPHAPRMRLHRIERPFGVREMAELQVGFYLEKLGSKPESMVPQFHVSRHSPSTRELRDYGNSSMIVDDLFIKSLRAYLDRLEEPRTEGLGRPSSRMVFRRAPRRHPKTFALWNAEV